MSGSSASKREVDVLIIGSGPTGLGAATRLHQQKHKNWLVIDSAEEAGGLACTDVTPEGFLFDMGGHVIFSHFDYFDQLLDAACGTGEENWAVHERVSYVWMRNRWVAYPFQNNISQLPVEDQVACLNGLVEAKVKCATCQDKPKDFDEWIMRVMGEGIADIFMRPYNFKVWAVPTTYMQCGWLGERVATVDTAKAISNVLHNKVEGGWGPNAVFRFPQKGGTGGIWKNVAKLLPQERFVFNSKVMSLDVETKTVKCEDGTEYGYNKLLTTMPLDITLKMVGKEEWSKELFYSSSHIIGIGLRGKNPHDNKCWLYFPEDDCPFYRATVFSHYAKANSPDESKPLPTLRRGDPKLDFDKAARPGPYWSLMFEVAESSFKPVDIEKVVEETIQGAINTSMISPDTEIVSIYHRRLEHGYPTPSLQRDGALDKALPYLREKGVWSRGRFGSYKYEVANQDHSCMIGVEAIDNMMFGAKEFTLFHCSQANARGKKNKDLVYNDKSFQELQTW